MNKGNNGISKEDGNHKVPKNSGEQREQDKNIDKTHVTNNR